MVSFLAIFAASYVVVQVVTFSECQPLYLYWRVLPDPGKCSQAQVQLITLGILAATSHGQACLTNHQAGVLNIITDIMLIVLPIPVLVKLRRSFFQYVITG